MMPWPRSEGFGPVEKAKRARRSNHTAGQDQGPAEDFHPPRHEEPGGVQGAAIEGDPNQRQPKQAPRRRRTRRRPDCPLGRPGADPAQSRRSNGGSSACATLRVGGDQNGSASLSAWRRASRNEPATAANATAIQYPMNARGASIRAAKATAAASVPNIPLAVITGARARR